MSAQIIVHLVLIQREKNATTERPVMSALKSDSLQVPKPKRTQGSKETTPLPDPERRVRGKKGKERQRWRDKGSDSWTESE